MGLVNTVVNALTTIGISSFGIGMPVMSPSWTDDSALPTSNDADMSLTVASGHTWLAPLAGTLRRIEGAAAGVTLVRAEGAPATGPGMLLTIFPQLYLRLSRLYAQVLEPAPGRAERNTGLPLRPVPRFFFYSGAVDASDVSGNVTPQSAIGQAGDLTIYDSNGFPIDPLAVASAFQAIMTKHNILQKRGLGDAFVSNSQVKQIAGLASPSSVRVRLSEHGGAPYDGSHLSGVTSAVAASGLFTLDSGLTGTISKEAGTGLSGSFPDEERRLLVLGPATTGRLGDQFSPQTPLGSSSLPASVTLARDFFSVRVVKLKTYLLGAPNQLDDGVKVEKQPGVRIHEPLNLLVDGNDVLAAAERALLGTPDESLAVGQTINGGFDVPDQTGADAHWPVFPPEKAAAASDGPLPVSLRDSFDPTAEYFDDLDGATANVDVVLTINGLPAEATVRVYPRKFIEDAREARGDGAGRIVPSTGVVTLLLRDPLNLRRRGIPELATIIPLPATLRFDLMVVKRTGEARLYGNVSAVITGSTITPAPSPAGINNYGSASRLGLTNAGILGLGGPSSVPSGSALDVILALAGEGNPRSAPRLPTMARRELLAAGHASGGNWSAVLAGGRLAEETHSADARLGVPGGLGGRETQVVGVSTTNGRLAHDIARMAFRRTTNLIVRMVELVNDRWNLPAQPAELPAGSAQTASAGTFAGAVLQTIAPFCETPELNLLKDFVDPTTLPSNFNDLVDLVVAHVPTDLPFRSELITQLNSLKSDSTLSETTRERLFNELHREIMSSGFGRRDAQWALDGAISNARRFIYIESPAFAATRKDYGADPVPPYALDLIEKIRDRMAVASGLCVVICTPKYPDFAAGYEPLAAHEVDDRRKRILGRLPSVPEMPQQRTVSFHPVGFPGRSSRLESTVVIVDDVWALVGSSSFRRRGLTFDGGSDLVFTDTDLKEGCSPAISTFRRRLMASRLGVSETATGDFGTMPHPDFVRLADGVEAFQVIREMLVAGGLGKTERLWNGRTPGVTPIDPAGVSIDLVSPEGREFDLASAAVVLLLATLSAPL